MCRDDGMVFDDGVGTRLAPDRFFLTTTTGNAGAVLDWLEEWLQTEWPELDVFCTSVTEEWANATLVGPRAREVLARWRRAGSTRRISRSCGCAKPTSPASRRGSSGSAFPASCPTRSTCRPITASRCGSG